MNVFIAAWTMLAVTASLFFLTLIGSLLWGLRSYRRYNRGELLLLDDEELSKQIREMVAQQMKMKRDLSTYKMPPPPWPTTGEN
jgi:hypothetical protein